MQSDLKIIVNKLEGYGDSKIFANVEGGESTIISSPKEL